MKIQKEDVLLGAVAVGAIGGGAILVRKVVRKVRARKPDQARKPAQSAVQPTTTPKVVHSGDGLTDTHIALRDRTWCEAFGQ